MSQDLFAAFKDLPPQPQAQPSKEGLGTANPPFRPATIESILGKSPVQTSTAPSPDPAPIDEDDDFGDFEDASREVSNNDRDVADILKDRMGSPVMDKRPSYFDDELAKAAAAAAAEKSLPTSRSPYRPEKSPNLPPSEPAPKELPFKPKSLSPSNAKATPTNLPFKPKSKSEAPSIGSHPFAGNMDLLFATGGDDDYDAGADDLNVDISNDPEAAMAMSKQLIAAQMADQERSKKASTAQRAPALKVEKPKREPNKLREKSQYAPAQNADVLFDFDDPANNEPELDEWGDFEGGSSTPAAASTMAAPRATTRMAPKTAQTSQLTSAIDLLGLDDPPTSAAAGLDDGWHAEARQRPATVQRAAPSTQAVPQASEDDVWDDFEDAAPPPNKTSTPTTSLPSLPKATSNLASKPQSSTTSSLPPTNIPPPLLLFSIFPSLISEAQSTLFDTLSHLPSDQKQDFLSHSATQQYLRGYIALATVLAHIIAGRKLRWKRDQFLAQGMRIGPASAGGRGGGMKLAGVDKTENAKEEREVLDLVRLWRAQAGKLRSAVTGANAAAGSAKLPAVPVIAEQMPIKMLKAVEGGLTAPHACALCGLKREERVARVDEEADDSFGEWWVEGMNMHLVCRNFWDQYKDRLRSK